MATNTTADGSTTPQALPGWLLLSILLISAATLGFEVWLVRFLALIQWHHFTALVISLALLGFGASGSYLAITRVTSFYRSFLRHAIMTALTMVLIPLLVQRLPLNLMELVWDPFQGLMLFVSYLLLSLPFFFAANCIGMALQHYTLQSQRLYASDLIGAGIGALSMIVVLSWFELMWIPIGLSLLLLSAATMAQSDRSKALARRTIPALIILLMLLPDNWLQPQLSPYKGLSQTLEVVGTQRLYSRHSLYGEVDLISSPEVPFRYVPSLSISSSAKIPEQLGLFIDGEGPLVLSDSREDQSYLDSVLGSLPFMLRPGGQTLLLGSRGDSHFHAARRYQISEVDSVMLNPLITQLLDGEWPGYRGVPHSPPRVHLHSADPRHFISGTTRRYDLIQLPLSDSPAVGSLGIGALQEHYLYTHEAFATLYQRLQPDGILSFSRWLKTPPRESLKLVAGLRRIWEENGDRPFHQTLVVLRSWNVVLLMVKRGSWSPQELRKIRDFASSNRFDLAYLPGLGRSEANRYNLMAQPYLFDGITALLGAESDGFIDGYPYAIEPATDDRPFFQQLFRWGQLRALIRERETGGVGLMEWGYPLQIIALIQAVIAALLFILLPLWWHSRMERGSTVVPYFAGLGLGFIFIEIAAIQHFTLFLGDPIFAVAVVLAGFLLFAGLGSYLSQRLEGMIPHQRLVLLAVAAIVAISLLYLLTLPWLFAQMSSISTPVRIVVVILLITPLAIAMGMPFPMGLKRLAGRERLVAWAWGINGSASVTGAILAAMIANHLGFSSLILIALLCYIIAYRNLPAASPI